jgi:hypothetical protein
MNIDWAKALPIIALAVSLISLALSWRTAWGNSFRPAKLVGAFPHLALWTVSSYKGDSPTGDIASRYLTPSFWLANVGAKEALVEDIRLRFYANGSEFCAYPVSSVPIEAVESPSLFHDKNRLGLGGPFSGFCLPRAQVWKCHYAFSMSPSKWEMLKNNVSAEVQVTLGGRKRWVTILKEDLAFGSHPIHLQGLRSGNMVAGSLMNHLVSRAWYERRQGTR